MSSMKLRFPLLVLSQISTLNVWKACFGGTALVLMICLSGCGGGNTAADLAGTTPSTTDNNVTGVVGTSDSGNSINNTPLFMTPGAYVATLNNKDWISIILRTQQGSGAVSNFLSLYYNGTDPDILSGSGLITGTDTAVLSRVLLSQTTVASVRLGNGTLTKPKENSVKAKANKLTYMQNSLSYLNQRAFEPFIELIKEGNKIEEASEQFKGFDI